MDEVKRRRGLLLDMPPAEPDSHASPPPAKRYRECYRLGWSRGHVRACAGAGRTGGGVTVGLDIGCALGGSSGTGCGPD
jgi:hypothetical protein